MAVIELKNITKSYYLGKQEIPVLRDVSLKVEAGEFVAIMGQSGSGKSTLMNLIGLLDTPTEGNYFFEQENVAKFSMPKQAKIRGEKIGFVFQSYNLIPRVSTHKQVALPLIYQGIFGKEQHSRVKKALETVEIWDKRKNKPNELSGGQQQRVSIARSLVTNPALILADEPTGALDSETGKAVLNLFKELNSQGKTIVMITHDAEIATHASRTIHIRDGKIIENVS